MGGRMGLPNSSPFPEIPKVSLLRRLRSDAPPVAALYGIFCPSICDYRVVSRKERKSESISVRHPAISQGYRLMLNRRASLRIGFVGARIGKLRSPAGRFGNS